MTTARRHRVREYLLSWEVPPWDGWTWETVRERLKRRRIDEDPSIVLCELGPGHVEHRVDVTNAVTGAVMEVRWRTR